MSPTTANYPNLLLHCDNKLCAQILGWLKIMFCSDFTHPPTRTHTHTHPHIHKMTAIKHHIVKLILRFKRLLFIIQRQRKVLDTRFLRLRMILFVSLLKLKCFTDLNVAFKKISTNRLSSMMWLDDLEDLFQPKWFCDFLNLPYQTVLCHQLWFLLSAPFLQCMSWGIRTLEQFLFAMR